jgi:FAD/FMN-containing dehydrogenase
LKAEDNSVVFLSACREILGERNVVTDDDVKAGYLEEPRKLYFGKALAVLRPGSTAEVSAVVKRCREFGVAVVPQGGNTGLVGGQIPDASGRQVVLSLKRMKAVREVDLASDTMIVEAGATLAEAQAAAAAHDRLYPLSLASEGSCTVGGNVSTNAGGVAVLSYGNTRELTRGVEVVLADGTVLNALSKLRKDNTGYDLKDLFIGAEGTLGVVTAAALKLFPTPRAQATAFVGLESAEKAMELLALAKRRFAQEVTSFELLPRICLDFEFRHVQGVREPLAGKHAWYVLIEISSVARDDLSDAAGALFEEALERGVIEDANLAASLEQRKAFWRIRETMPDTQMKEGVSLKHDVAVGVADVPALYKLGAAAVEAAAPGSRLVAFGHAGDGNIHFNVSQPVGADPVAFRDKTGEIQEAVFAVVAKLGGSISAEHGIGLTKRDVLPRFKDPAALATMRSIKVALDPTNIFNPGKVL